MNYGPYMGFPYLATAPARTGIFSRLLGGINFGSILTNTQKTLSIVNQTIPVIKQVQPVLKNAKTMFRVMNEFKRTDNEVKPTTVNNTTNETKTEEVVETQSVNNGPTFFM